MDHDATHRGTTRRRLLQLGLGLAATPLAGCGGGGGGGGEGGGAPPPPPGGAAPAGRLVYRNRSAAAVWDFATRRELQFDPGDHPLNDPGVGVSRTGIISSAIQGDNDGFGFALFDLAGQRTATYDVRRALAFQTGAVVFNADATRIALSVDEPASATDDTRIARTLIASWPDGAILGTVDGYGEPVWVPGTGELVVRHGQTTALRVFDSALNDQGELPGLTTNSRYGGYNLSADGRYVVWSEDNIVRVRDRRDGGGWVAATRQATGTESPCLSPDGRFLAIFALLIHPGADGAFSFYGPHVLPFQPGLTVAVDTDLHGLGNTLVSTDGRMGWIA